jgi:hypothetical protein
MSGNKKDSKTEVSNTTKKNEEEENAELVRITVVIFPVEMFTVLRNEG